MNTDSKQWHIGLVGYGEVGRILAEDLRTQGVTVSAHDIKLASEAGSPLRQHAAEQGVTLFESHAELADAADFIISAVTASQAVPVAQACAPAIQPSAFFLDFNSASPGAKIRAADIVNAQWRALCRRRGDDLRSRPTASRCRCCWAGPMRRR